MLFKLLDKSIGLISTLVLARVLVPADFGLVAMATAVVAFTQLLSAFGFDSALIQRQDAHRGHYDTAWTFNVIFGVVVATALVLLSSPMARFYEDVRLVKIMLALAIGALVSGFENVGTVAFRKELDFRSEFRFLLVKRIAATAVTLGLALGLRSYWALVAGSVTSQVLSVLISYRLHPFRPRLTLERSADLMHFSKWIFLSSLITFFHSRSTDFILGRTVGSHGLGVYNVGVEIAAMPSTELIAPLNRAVYPAYARLNKRVEQLRERFLEVFGVIALLGLPVSAGLYAVAEPAVLGILGPKWVETIPIIRVFAAAGLFSALSSNLYLVLVAIGKPQANTFLSGGLLLLSLPTVVWASLKYGIQGAALAQLGTATLAFLGIVTVFTRIVRIRIGQLAAVVWRPIVSSIALLGSLLAVDSWQLNTGVASSAIARLMILLAVGVCIYPVMAWLLWKLSGSRVGAEELILGVIKQQIRSFTRRGPNAIEKLS